MAKVNNTGKEKIPPELFKKIKKIEIKSHALVNEAMSGNYNSVFRGQGIEFQEVREYSIGDDYRTIDWNVTARHSTPYIKRFREERELNVMLLIDASGSLEYGSTNSNKSEKLTETAATIAFTALSNQDKIGAVFFTGIIEKVIMPSKNKNSILRLIREILYLKPENRLTDVNNALEYINKSLKRRGIIFILSDFNSPVDIKKLLISKKKHDIIPIVFTDPFEELPVNVGLVDLIDNETNEIILVDTSSKAFFSAMKKRSLDRKNFFNELKKNNIEPMVISTTDEIDKVINNYFKKRIKKFRL